MRNHIRHNAGIPIDIVHENNKYKFILLNVSMGGIACKGDKQFEVQTEVQIHIPQLKPDYTTRGKIVWCKKAQDLSNNGLYELGIEHCGEKDKAQLRMVEQISNIEHYRIEVKTTEGRVLTGDEAAREWISIYSSD